MGTKYDREGFRDQARGLLRNLERPVTRNPHRHRALNTFLLVYAGVGAYMVLGMYLDSIMGTEERPSNIITAPATVTARGAEPVQENPVVYTLDIEVTPKEEEPFTHQLFVDEESWEKAEVGKSIHLRYERVGPEDRVLVLHVQHRDSLDVPAPYAMSDIVESAEGDWVEPIAMPSENKNRQD